MAIVTPEWVRDAVFYQIFPDRFARSSRLRAPGPFEAWDTPPTVHGFKGGDLLGVAEHLDYLQALGITAIYFNPIFQSASNHRYHTYDYMAVDPLLGGDAALRELIDAAHVRGMRVVLDGVFNHASRGFWPFHHVMETGKDSPYRGWFHFDGSIVAGPESHERLSGPPKPGTRLVGEVVLDAETHKAIPGAGGHWTVHMEPVSDRFSVGFTTHTALVPESFRGHPVVQMEFEAYVPWVLSEQDPCQPDE